ncbi:MAG TPA: type I methionyl aminopeptidase [Clostridiaceae bacterium]|jgi:methionyl aminopeptidase|nr:type I methionyl aminopeptidase [Clostridiaceae bacterium]
MITIKSKSELEIMRKAGEIVALAHEKIKEAIKPGVTTKELDRIAEEVIIKSGATPSFKGVRGMPDAPLYPASICASVNDEVVHGIPGLRVLNDGDIISIDIGAFYGGFHADAARTHPVGKISIEAERLIMVTMECFYEGLKQAVFGNRISDISAAIQVHAEKNGYSVVREYVGHGIGREMWEPPQIPNFRTRERGPRLQPGMTLAVEPMINAGRYEIKIDANKWTVRTLDGSLSAHYENTLAVTDGEPVILTKLD